MSAISSIPNFSGGAEDGFGVVVDAFTKNFSEDAELGASFSVFIDDAPVVDIVGGVADRSQKSPWTDETVACIYSSGKAVVAFLVAQAVDDGLLDYDTPVAAYWPAFAENGKEEITLAQALSHQGGLAAIADEDMAPSIWLDWPAVTERIARMAPLWPPGSANGYHPQTVGFIAGEVLSRVRGESVGALLRKTGLDVFCGMAPDEMERAARMTKPPRAPDLGEMTELKRLAFVAKSAAPGRVDPADWMAAEIPASNMHANARALARFLYGFVDQDGAGALAPQTRASAFRERIRGDDLVLPFNLSWAAGLMVNVNRHFGPNPGALGHAGFGGSCVVIDPQTRMTTAYVMNKMSPALVGDPRAVKLLDALYTCL